MLNLNNQKCEKLFQNKTKNVKMWKNNKLTYVF